MSTEAPKIKVVQSKSRPWLLISLWVSFCLICGLSVVLLSKLGPDCEQLVPSANLAGCEFSQRDLNHIDLTNANLTDAKFINANLQDAILSGANLTQADLTDADLTGAKLNGIKLDGAVLVHTVGLADEVLAGALNVSIEDLTQTIMEKQIRLETRDEIIRAIGDVCTGHVVPGTSSVTGNSIMLLNAKGEAHPWNNELGLREPMAVRFVNVAACVDEEKVNPLSRDCDYIGGPPITRHEYSVNVRLVAVNSGEILKEFDVYGIGPDFCPESAPAGQTELYGERDKSSELELWLSQALRAIGNARLPHPRLDGVYVTEKNRQGSKVYLRFFDGGIVKMTSPTGDDFLANASQAFEYLGQENSGFYGQAMDYSITDDGWLEFQDRHGENNRLYFSYVGFLTDESLVLDVTYAGTGWKYPNPEGVMIVSQHDTEIYQFVAVP